MKFVALGAANSIGASCYYLDIGDQHILLDCGTGITDTRIVYGPEWIHLIPEILVSTSQLDAIFISHAHLDHIGYLPELSERSPGVPIYATDLTKKLGWNLMMDNAAKSRPRELDTRDEREAATQAAFDRITAVPYSRSFLVGDVRVTFYEAGHVPGAAMIYLETADDGSVLYTGDWSAELSCISNGYVLPAGLRPDRIILCGVHAKHPAYMATDDRDNLLGELADAVYTAQPCLIVSRELTKGIELMVFLADRMDQGQLPATKIYIDDRVWALCERMHEVGIPVLNARTQRFPRFWTSPVPEPGLYIGGPAYTGRFPRHITPRFTLHADYRECAHLIEKLWPHRVVLVHSPDDEYWGHHGNTALEEAHREVSFLYPEIGKVYEI